MNPPFRFTGAFDGSISQSGLSTAYHNPEDSVLLPERRRSPPLFGGESGVRLHPRSGIIMPVWRPAEKSWGCPYGCRSKRGHRLSHWPERLSGMPGILFPKTRAGHRQRNRERRRDGRPSHRPDRSGNPFVRRRCFHREKNPCAAPFLRFPGSGSRPGPDGLSGKTVLPAHKDTGAFRENPPSACLRQTVGKRRRPAESYQFSVQPPPF